MEQVQTINYNLSSNVLLDWGSSATATTTAAADPWSSTTESLAAEFLLSLASFPPREEQKVASESESDSEGYSFEEDSEEENSYLSSAEDEYESEDDFGMKIVSDSDVSEDEEKDEEEHEVRKDDDFTLSKRRIKKKLHRYESDDSDAEEFTTRKRRPENQQQTKKRANPLPVLTKEELYASRHLDLDESDNSYCCIYKHCNTRFKKLGVPLWHHVKLHKSTESQEFLNSKLRVRVKSSSNTHQDSNSDLTEIISKCSTFNPATERAQKWYLPRSKASIRGTDLQFFSTLANIGALQKFTSKEEEDTYYCIVKDPTRYWKRGGKNIRRSVNGAFNRAFITVDGPNNVSKSQTIRLGSIQLNKKSANEMEIEIQIEKPVEREKKGKCKTGYVCESCSVTKSPEWRNGPDGPKTLCNACGVQYAKCKRRGLPWIPINSRNQENTRAPIRRKSLPEQTPLAPSRKRKLSLPSIPTPPTPPPVSSTAPASPASPEPPASAPSTPTSKRLSSASTIKQLLSLSSTENSSKRMRKSRDVDFQKKRAKQENNDNTFVSVPFIPVTPESSPQMLPSLPTLPHMEVPCVSSPFPPMRVAAQMEVQELSRTSAREERIKALHAILGHCEELDPTKDKALRCYRVLIREKYPPGIPNLQFLAKIVDSGMLKKTTLKSNEKLYCTTVDISSMVQFWPNQGLNPTASIKCTFNDLFSRRFESNSGASSLISLPFAFASSSPTSSQNSGDESSSPPPLNSPSIPRWNDELHRKFLFAIKHFGVHKASPKEILRHMNVEGLTRQHVRNHLIALRKRLPKIKEAKIKEGVITSDTDDDSWFEPSLFFKNTSNFQCTA